MWPLLGTYGWPRTTGEQIGAQAMILCPFYSHGSLSKFTVLGNEHNGLHAYKVRCSLNTDFLVWIPDSLMMPCMFLPVTHVPKYGEGKSEIKKKYILF